MQDIDEELQNIKNKIPFKTNMGFKINYKSYFANSIKDYLENKESIKGTSFIRSLPLLIMSLGSRVAYKKATISIPFVNIEFSNATKAEIYDSSGSLELLLDKKTDWETEFSEQKIYKEDNIYLATICYDTIQKTEKLILLKKNSNYVKKLFQW